MARSVRDQSSVRPRSAWRLLTGVALLLSSTLSAQSYSLAKVDSLVLRGDSTDALRVADEAIRSDRGSAEAWHRRGMLAWRMSGVDRRTGFMKRTVNDSLESIADSSLRIATTFERRPQYLTDLGRFYLTSNSAATRGHATNLFKEALNIARANHDSVGISDASDALGMHAWRSYENLADRHIYSYIIQDPKAKKFLHDPRAIAYFIDRETIRAAAQDWAGQRPYLESMELLSNAVRADPTNLNAERHYYMGLADRQRWIELEHAGREQLLRNPKDPWAWFVRGLANHRLENDASAAAAFDSAMANFSDAERSRYDRLTRIYRPKDSTSYASLPPDERRLNDRMYWLMADPLWLTPSNEHHLEFLSRVAYAELRFSVDEYGVRGADTDRGEVYIRFGPPPAIIGFPPDPTGTGEHRIVQLWWYTENEAFIFRLLPGYGMAALDVPDAREVKRLRDTVPVVWTADDENSLVDTITTQLVRFRSNSADSAEVYVAAQVPVARLVRGIDLARGLLEVDFEGYNWRAQQVFRDTSREVVDFRHKDPTTTKSWSTRVRAGTFLYRVEALQPDAVRGARAASRIDIPESSGFGLSDLLLADQAAQRPGHEAYRWSDLDITPNVGTIKRGKPFAIVWETYGLGERDSQNTYRVSISLSRHKGGGLGGFAAKIVGGVASAIGLSSQTAPDHVTLSFPRQAAARPVALDFVALDLDNAPAGQYVLEVDVTDLVTNQHATRESAVTIIE